MKVTKKTSQLYRSKSRINVLKGGAGSGKSVGTTQVEIRKGFENVERVLVVRKVARTLRDSCFQLFKDILSQSGFVRGQHYEFNSTSMSVQLQNGTVFLFAGLDDVDKLKSIAGISRIVIEESDQISEDDFDQLDLRLRGENLHFPQITLMLNPVSQSHWIKKRFFDTIDPDVLIIESNYLDNPFLDEGYVSRLKALQFTNPRKHRIYVLNEWGIEDIDKMFIRNMNRIKHLVECKHNPNEDTYLAWDLNYDPTCLVIQKTNEGINILREYRQKGITLPYVCAQINKDYPGAFFIINGDASGHYSRTLDNSTHYQVIQECLDLSLQQFNIPKANPTHRRSRLHCNAMFDFRKVNIHPSCVGLIADIESAIVDNVGSLDPWKKDNPELSHYIDPLRYHIHSEHHQMFTELNLLELK